MISIKLTSILICCWIFNNMYLVWCAPPKMRSARSKIQEFFHKDIPKGKFSNGYIEGNVAAFAFQGRRDNMEDEFVIKKNKKFGISLFAIFDGHIGDFAAKYAKNNLIKQLENIIVEIKQYIQGKRNNAATQELQLGKYEKYINQLDNKINYEELLKGEILEFDVLLIAELQKKNDQSGTTATIALIDKEEKQLWVANVGDSRAVMCDREGNAVALSVDHIVGNAEERSRIEDIGGIFLVNRGALRLNGEIMVTRALGDPGYLKENNQLIADPYIRNIDLSTDRPKFLILASDGLWDVYNNAEAVAFIKEKYESKIKNLFSNVARSITMAAYQKESRDNIAAIVIKLPRAQ